MIKINYKSDFKINEKSETVALEVPFVFSYYVFDSKKYVVSFDGHNYVNCERKEDGSLDVIFNQPDFGIGHLKVERKYAVDDKAFVDGVYDIVTVDNTDVFITSGKTFETYVETLVVPPYIKGDKGDKGDPMTWSGMTKEEQAELVQEVTASTQEADLLEKVTGNEKISVSDGSGVPKAITTEQIKNYIEGSKESSSLEFVDLGLPSGTLWATRNIGAEKPEDSGLFFAWGETEGYNVSYTEEGGQIVNTTIKDADGNLTERKFNFADYKWSNGAWNSLTKYNTNSSYGVVDNLSRLLTDDDATYAVNNTYRIPSVADFEELMQYTTFSKVSIGSKKCGMFTAANGNYVIFPVTGTVFDQISSVNSAVYYPTCEINPSNPSTCKAMLISNYSELPLTDFNSRCTGLPVRAVKSKETGGGTYDDTEIKAQIKENADNIAANKADADEKLTELASKVEELNNISESNEDGFFVTDEQGNVALSVNEKGETNFSPSEELIYKLNKKGFVSESNEDGFFVTDEQGNVALKITEEDGFEAAIYERPELDVEPADIYHIITYGQSLSCGFESFPIQSNIQKYDSLMFNTGVIYDMADSIDKITDFVPLTEQKYGSQGETPCSGISEGLVESFVKYTGMKRRGFQLLLSACGVGGANINTLMQENYLQRVYDVIDKGRAIASQKGKTYKVMAVLWMQGEANATAYDADNESYKQNLKQILNSINSYAKSATGQIMDVENFTYLPCTNANPAVAIYELCKDTETNLTCCGAIYREKQNKIHLLGAASYSYGYRCGVAMFKKVFFKKAVKNVHPLKHYVDGNNIYITFAADKYPVQLSNYLLRWKQSSLTDDVSIVDGGNNVDFATDKSNYGFSIKNREGNEIITEVSVSRYDMIKIVCSESPIGCTMLYACKPYLLHHEGNSPIGSRIYGGVCDSGNLKISTSDGIENLISVCVPFYINL